VVVTTTAGHGGGANRRWCLIGLVLLSTAACADGPPGADADAGDDGLDGSVAPASPRLCVFDYDLTLQSHHCALTNGTADKRALYHCRANADACITHGWNDEQCIAVGAREAIARCVREGAFVGIASFSDFAHCWEDKVAAMVAERQFPELLDSPKYGTATPFSYPALDDKSNWNCPTCAYQMGALGSKSALISRVMVHYGLDPHSKADRERVIFWDDTVNNIDDVEAHLPGIETVLVPRSDKEAYSGCGITQAEIDSVWP